MGPLGRTGAVNAFLVVTAAVSDVLYRWVEVPAARWLSERTRRIGRKPRETTPTGTSEQPDPAANLRPVDTSDRA